MIYSILSNNPVMDAPACSWMHNKYIAGRYKTKQKKSKLLSNPEFLDRVNSASVLTSVFRFEFKIDKYS